MWTRSTRCVASYEPSWRNSNAKSRSGSSNGRSFRRRPSARQLFSQVWCSLSNTSAAGKRCRRGCNESSVGRNLYPPFFVNVRRKSVSTSVWCWLCRQLAWHSAPVRLEQIPLFTRLVQASRVWNVAAAWRISLELGHFKCLAH